MTYVVEQLSSNVGYDYGHHISRLKVTSSYK